MISEGRKSIMFEHRIALSRAAPAVVFVCSASAIGADACQTTLKKINYDAFEK
jgi:hypothetical protein